MPESIFAAARLSGIVDFNINNDEDDINDENEDKDEFKDDKDEDNKG